MGLLFPFRWGDVQSTTPMGFRSVFMRQIGGLGSPAFTPPVTTRTNWDTSDPLFYDWWRKRALDERAKLEVVQEIIEEATPALRVETIDAVEAATSVAEIQSLDLLKYERDILRAAIADYQRMIDEDEEEAAILLLMH